MILMKGTGRRWRAATSAPEFKMSQVQITEMIIDMEEPDLSGSKKNSSMARYRISSKCYYAVLFLVAALSLWIRTGFPVFAIPASPADDQLFIRTARYLEAGQWLGPYDNLTLAKGMFYPVFIVLAFWASVPLKIAEQIVYLFVSAMTAGVVRRQAGNSLLGVILFALLAFNPVFWNLQLARVIREGLYISLSLAVVTLAIMIAFPLSREENLNFRRSVFQGFGLGLVGAAYWMTREEGIWLLPAVAVVIAVALLGLLHSQWIPITEREASPQRFAQLRAIALPLLLALGVFTAADWLVAGLNYRHYGIFETNEFRSKSFLRAYGALSRIQHDKWERYIPFPKDVRLRAYSVSPAARELVSSLEGPTGEAWLNLTCSLAKTTPCVEVHSGWAMWELRDAVAAAGHYRSGAEAMKFYETLADQINSACANGTIRCLPPRATLSPPFQREYLGETIKASPTAAKVLFKMVEGPVGSGPSAGPAQGDAIFADTVGGVYLPDEDRMVVRGWTAAPTATPTIRLVDRIPGQVESTITLTPAPDVLAVFPNLKAVRFELKTDCPVSTCDLLLTVVPGGESSISLARVVQGPVINTPQIQVYVDSVSVDEASRLTSSRRAVQVKIASVIASIYAALFPTLAIIGLAGLVLATLLRRRFPIPTALLALGLGSAAAVGTRIVLLAYIDATSFPAANLLYASPASPFVIIFTFVGMYSWYVAFLGGHRQVSRPQYSSQPQSARPDIPRPRPSGPVGV